MRHEMALRRRLHTLHTLHDAVAAMRSLSAHHLRVLRQALPAAHAYRADIESVVAAIGLYQPRHGLTPGGLVVVASDLGLCGDYNTRLAQQTLAEHDQRKLGAVYAVGRRVRPALARAGITPQRNYEAPVSLDGLARLLLHLAQDVLEDYVRARIGALHLVSARFDGLGCFTPMCTRLLPLAPMRSAALVRPSPYVTAGCRVSLALRRA